MKPITPDKIPVSTKLTYGSGTCIDMWGNWLFPSVAYAVFNVYLGVPPTFIGLALTIIRLYDAFSDPILGWLSDNTRSRFGRRRPYILIAGILVGIGLPCLFLAPESWKDAQFLGAPTLFWYIIGAHAIFIPLVSAANVPFQSLGVEMTPDYDERTSVMAYKNGLQKVFEVGFYLALPFTNLAFFTLPDSGGQDVLKGVMTYTAILGSFMALASITIFFKVEERYYKQASCQEKVSVLDSIYKTLKCRPFRWLILYGLAFQLGVSMVSSLGYYTTVYHVCGGDTVAGNNWNGLMGPAYMVGGLIGVPIASWIGRHHSKRIATIVITLCGILIYLGTWILYNPIYPWMQLLASGGIAFTSAGLWTMHASMGADVIDFDELDTGKRREGVFSASGSYILKLGNSLGYFCAGLVLQLTGFDANLEVQDPSSILSIRLFLAAIPVLGLLIVLVAIRGYPISRDLANQIRIELEDRRGCI